MIKVPTQQQYEAQIIAMAANARCWLDAHPGIEIKVQFNYPKNVFVSVPISDAIKHLWIMVNGPAEEMIKAMWRQDDDSEPTIFMVKAALEIAMKENKNPR